MADEEMKTEEVAEVAKPITADIPYGKGLPTVLMPFMGPFDQITDSIVYKAQLVARDQKLSSGVNASMPIGAVVGFLFAILMILLPLYL
ncbi:MAG TPA: tetrahydromethanopterin S-methyltransferase subunit F [Methanothrix sp.]|nr:tetrahydromethanopterin S-methyltransferase subunit F [Methanothrix sp.]HRW82654.1 tetrahydromethanopterin S-methyltransferase subunit F [Methanothrix sp.]